ncbi:MAG: hypothetical protein R3F54_12200 [Alphaproteobacteria bacterium]
MAIVENLLKRQYVDWTGLRLEQSASDKVFVAVDELAQQIVDAIARSGIETRPTAIGQAMA